jgi:hypothetical protein
MPVSEEDIVAALKAKGADAPRLTPEEVHDMIASSHEYQPEGTTLTICVLTLRNGFTVVGQSAAASPENFDEHIGRQLAFEDAKRKVWAFAGYGLRDRLASTVRAALVPGSPAMETAAALAHEVNRIWCAMNGDFSQPAWPMAPQWQRDSAWKGVMYHSANPSAGPEAGHNNWLADKRRDGWVYGAIKDPEAKTHPCMVAFDDLPLDQQIKDRLFKAVVHAVVGAVYGHFKHFEGSDAVTDHANPAENG